MRCMPATAGSIPTMTKKSSWRWKMTFASASVCPGYSAAVADGSWEAAGEGIGIGPPVGETAVAAGPALA